MIDWREARRRSSMLMMYLVVIVMLSTPPLWVKGVLFALDAAAIGAIWWMTRKAVGFGEEQPAPG